MEKKAGELFLIALDPQTHPTLQGPQTRWEEKAPIEVEKRC